MSPARSGLGGPPVSLNGFPEAAAATELHRLSEHPGAWWYSSVARQNDPDGGRFDLTRPDGTCYAAESLAGAVVEKLFRTPAKVVVAERLTELFHLTAVVRVSPRTADLTNRRATGFGLNAEVQSSLDYAPTRQWATALHAAGFRALRYRLRNDVSQRLAGRALFGRAGLRRRTPAGMSSTVQSVDIDRIESILTGLGVDVRPIPARVPIEPPPPLHGR